MRDLIDMVMVVVLGSYGGKIGEREMRRKGKVSRAEVLGASG